MNLEDFDSDSSDDDYVPTKEVVSEQSSGEDDDDINEDRTIANKTNKCNKSRRKKKNSRLTYEDDVNNDNDEELTVETKSKNDEDIWADFLADTNEKEETCVKKPKNTSWASLLGNKKSKVSKAQTNDVSVISGNNSLSESSSASISKNMPQGTKSTVKITEVYEFAGEEVKVEKTVPVDSKEVKFSTVHSSSLSKDIPSRDSKRRTGGLAGLVSSLNKKPKLSTLEKSKLDWQAYKEQEGLVDELLLHTKSKDTYLEKQEFLQRADLRQFELERDLRQGVKRTSHGAT